MSKTLIGFTEEDIKFTISVFEFAKKKLQENHDASYSGVEQLLINSSIIRVGELLTEFQDALPKPVPVAHEVGLDAEVY